VNQLTTCNSPRTPLPRVPVLPAAGGICTLPHPAEAEHLEHCLTGTGSSMWGILSSAALHSHAIRMVL